MGELKTFFETFLTKKSLFINKKAIQAHFMPGEVLHRDEQIQVIANTLAPALRMEKPSNLFIYGKTGSGKTLCVKHVIQQMKEVAAQKELPLQIIYLNCKLKKVADTEYRMVAQLARETGKEIPPTGLPTDEVYGIFFNAIDQKRQAVLIVLDEIDQLVKKAGDELLYNFTRINGDLKNAHISLVGISNDLVFIDLLDPRIKSSLSEEELVFPSYNALQIKSILKKRAKIAFKEGTLQPGVIEKCAAYAAREHGDARRALELLRVAGELAERQEQETVSIANLDKAEEKIEKDRVNELVETQPKHHKAVLYASLALPKQSGQPVYTGDVYELYRDICKRVGLRPLTQRRVSDVLSELDMTGILNAKVISKGRYGRTREISPGIPRSMKNKTLSFLQDALNL
ncbi:MAG: ORC1-type DNA replication protein [DPANN group archaeon]|nr:ORC1-type DNA replication protein [DPANN group archaeon]